MIRFTKQGMSAEFNVGDTVPTKMFQVDPGTPDGITIVEGQAVAHNLLTVHRNRNLKIGDVPPQVTFGVDYCSLNCPYCLNTYNDRGGEFALSKYGTVVPHLAKLLNWISESSPYRLGWAVGESLSTPAFNMLEELQHALPESTRKACQTIMLHSNGLYLASHQFDNKLMEGWGAHRRFFWTLSLLSEDDKSHRSIEKHFSLIMEIAANYRNIAWPKGMRIIIPSHVDIDALPSQLLSRAMQVIETASPEWVEPFYLVHLDEGAVKIHHSQYYPNITRFIEIMDASGVCNFPNFFNRYAEFTLNNRLTIYDKIIQTDSNHQFLLPDFKTVVDANNLPQSSYREVMGARLFDTMGNLPGSPEIQAVSPMCLKCDAFSGGCSAYERRETVDKGSLEFDATAHRQYRDTCCNLFFLYGTMFMNRVAQHTAKMHD